MTDSTVSRKSTPGEVGHGTVLVVDNEPAMLRLLRLVLAGEGFAVIEAHGGPQAVEAAARQEGPIHVLLTDVDLAAPMTGRELAQRLLVARPAMRVLYMSADFPFHEAVKDPPEDMEFVTKPLGMSALVRRVRELLAAGLAHAVANGHPPAGSPDRTNQ